MGHNPSRQKEHNHRRILALAHDKDERDQARAIVALWNERAAARKDALFAPFLRTIIASRCTWLTIACEGCGTLADIDLTIRPRATGMTLDAIVPTLSCPRCPGARQIARRLYDLRGDADAT